MDMDCDDDISDLTSCSSPTVKKKRVKARLDDNTVTTTTTTSTSFCSVVCSSISYSEIPKVPSLAKNMQEWNGVDRRIRKLMATLGAAQVPVLLTRFNQETWNRCSEFRLQSGWPCLYAPSQLISDHVLPLRGPAFVVEMNNTQNLVCGIGLILSEPVYVPSGQRHKFYRSHLVDIIYRGTLWIPRDDDRIREWCELLEPSLFFGKKHCKRGKGLTKAPRHIHQCFFTETDVSLQHALFELFYTML